MSESHIMIEGMAETLNTKLHITSWDEKPIHELEGGRKVTRAEVALIGTDDAVTEAGFHAVLYYRSDGTSSYVSIMRMTATLQGRSGSFVLRGDGAFDGTTATGDSTIVDGSGTADLAGIAGTAHSASTHEDYPHMPLTLTYELG
jgi:Protein of unknown function (DUF3224)